MLNNSKIYKCVKFTNVITDMKNDWKKCEKIFDSGLSVDNSLEV